MRTFLSAAVIFFVTTVVSASPKPLHRMSEPVRGLYLVSLQGVPPSQVNTVGSAFAQRYKGRLRHVFSHASTGFSVQLSDAQAQALAQDPVVDFVEEVAVAHESVTQPSPVPWQLDRIDQLSGTDGSYTYFDDGTNVLIYVIGHGVYRDHDEFVGPSGARVLRGVKFASDDSIAPGDTADYGYYPCGSPGAKKADGSSATDWSGNSGHETGVASFAAGVTQGVAKGAQIVPIRVWDCNGFSTSESFNWAFDWIMDPSRNPYYNTSQAVVNLSGGVGTCDSDVGKQL